MHRTTTLAIGLTAALTAGLFAIRFAGAEGEGPPTPQKKVDQPFVKHILGTWDYVATGEVEGKGTMRWSLGVADTVVIEDLDGAMMGQPFSGHGMWKVGADGSFRVWWLDNFVEKPDAYAGTITADGYDMKQADGDQHLQLRKTDKGLEMKISVGDEAVMTISFTRKK